MGDNRKTKEQLIQEVEDFRRRIAELEKLETERKQAGEKLRETETRYRQLVDLAPVGIYEFDLTTARFISVNEVMCEYTGFTEKELLVLNPLELMTEESQKLFLERMAHYATGKLISPTAEYQARTKDGRKFWMSVNTKYFYQAGIPVRATVVAYDITERKRADEALLESSRIISETNEFNKKILDSSPIGILTYLESGQCLFANESVSKIVGTNIDILLAQNYHQIHPWRRSGMYEAALKALRTGREQELETHMISTFGKEVRANVRFTTFFSKGEKHLLIFMVDISERKRAEEALRQAHDELERRVTARTEDLRQMNMDLKAQITERKRTEEALKKSEENLRLLSNRLITAQENERKRIAFELHDELGQSLVGLKFQLILLRQINLDFP